LIWLGQETFVPYVNIRPTIKGFAWRTEKLNTTPFLFRDCLKFNMRMWIIMRCLMKAIAHLRGRRYSFIDRRRLPGNTRRNSATQAAKVHDKSPLNRSLSNPRLRGVLLSANHLSYNMATNESGRETGLSNAQSNKVICPIHVKSAIALLTCCVFASSKCQPVFKK